MMRHVDYKDAADTAVKCCKSGSDSGVGGESKEQGSTTCVDSRRQDRRDQGTELTKLLPSQRQNIIGPLW